MPTSPYFCEATHIKSDDGCYEEQGHEGQHRGWELTENGAKTFYWDGNPVLVEQTELLTTEELAILAALVVQVDKFFPELGPKLLRLKAATE